MNVQNNCNDSLSNSLTDIEIWTWCGSNLGEVRDEAATKDEVHENDRFRGLQAGKFGKLGNPEQLIDVYMCGATFVECFHSSISLNLSQSLTKDHLQPCNH